MWNHSFSYPEFQAIFRYTTHTAISCFQKKKTWSMISLLFLTLDQTKLSTVSSIPGAYNDDVVHYMGQWRKLVLYNYMRFWSLAPSLSKLQFLSCPYSGLRPTWALKHGIWNHTFMIFFCLNLIMECECAARSLWALWSVSIPLHF